MSNLARELERKPIINSPQKQKQVQLQSTGKRKITSGERVLYFFTIIGVVFATYLIISTYASIYIINKDIHNLELSIKQQSASNEALELQVTELSAPDRILKIATENLGMTLDDKKVKVVQN